MEKLVKATGTLMTLAVFGYLPVFAQTQGGDVLSQGAKTAQIEVTQWSKGFKPMAAPANTATQQSSGDQKLTFKDIAEKNWEGSFEGEEKSPTPVRQGFRVRSWELGKKKIKGNVHLNLVTQDNKMQWKIKIDGLDPVAFDLSPEDLNSSQNIKGENHLDHEYTLTFKDTSKGEYELATLRYRLEKADSGEIILNINFVYSQDSEYGEYSKDIKGKLTPKISAE